MIAIVPVDTLFYCDRPLVLLAEDDYGKTYVCLLVVESPGADTFLCALPSAQVLAALLARGGDLRSVFEDRDSQLFSGTDLCPGRQARIAPLAGAPPSEWLPDPGFLISVQPKAPREPIAAAAAESGRAQIDLCIGPHGETDHAVDAAYLAAVLAKFVNMVKQAYLKVRKGLRSVQDDRVDDGTGCALEAIATSVGSFSVSLRSAALEGQHEAVEAALDKLAELTSEVTDLDLALQVATRTRGRLVNAYVAFLKCINDNGTQVRFEWAVPHRRRVVTRSFEQPVAAGVYEKLLAITDVEEEDIVFEGFVEKIDTKKSTWGIRNAEDGKMYRGGLHESALRNLAGITVGSVVYRFACRWTERETSMGKRRKSYALVSYQAVEDNVPNTSP